MERTPKILYVITKSNWGGAQRYVFELAGTAVSEGYEVVVAFGETGELKTKLEGKGVRTIRVEGMRNEASLRAIMDAVRGVLSIVREERPQVLHLNSSLAGFAGAVAGRIARVPRIIFTAHGWAFNEERSLLQRSVARVIHYMTVLLSHKTICVSEAVCRDMARMPLAKERMTVIHNGIAPFKVRSKKEARAALLPDLEKKMWIGSIGELHPSKRFADAIEAMALLGSRFPDVALVIMGEGAERQKLESLIIERGLQGKVFLVGHVSEASSYLSAFDIFVFPSRTEALGYALLEAGIAKLPAVASRVGGIPEIIVDRENGILVRKEHSKELAVALQRLIEDKELRKKLGGSLRTRVIEHFPLEKMLEKTFALY